MTPLRITQTWVISGWKELVVPEQQGGRRFKAKGAQEKVDNSRRQIHSRGVRVGSGGEPEADYRHQDRTVGRHRPWHWGGEEGSLGASLVPMTNNQKRQRAARCGEIESVKKVGAPGGEIGWAGYHLWNIARPTNSVELEGRRLASGAL
uniref:Uncharacterized protein n=1 Tax=Plectus sambesii TaxID=2011161 RepID=A0A914VBQ3_9BILA